MSETKLSSHEIIVAMKVKYPEAKGYLTMTEVPSSVGFSPKRCDFVAISTWQSKGLVMIGHEIKVSRNDWQKEMSQPDKSQTFERFCDTWFLVGAKGVAKVEEIPPSWGFIEATIKDGKVVLTNRKLPTVTTPTERTTEFWFALVRHAMKANRSEDLVKSQVRRAFEEGVASERERQSSNPTPHMKKLQEFQQSHEELERLKACLGMKWTSTEEILDAIGKYRDFTKQFDHAQSQVKYTARTTIKFLQALRKLELTSQTEGAKE